MTQISKYNQNFKFRKWRVVANFVVSVSLSTIGTKFLCTGKKYFQENCKCSIMYKLD